MISQLDLSWLRKRTIVRSEMTRQLARTSLRAAFSLSENLGARAAARLFTTPRRHRRPDREALILRQGRPFTIPVVRRAPFWAGASEVEVAAWRWGSGPVALLVHGWEGRGAQLGAFVEPLVEAGMTVVAFDAPAHGDSPGDRLFLADMADCVGQLGEHLGGVHAVIAHSFGSAATLLAHRSYGFDASRNVFVAPAAVARAAISSFAETLALGQGDVAALRQRLAFDSGVSPAELGLDNLAAERDAGLLIFHDEQDREVSISQARELEAHWPGARLVTTAGLGHRRILRDADVVAAAVTYATHSAPVSASDLPRALA